MTASTLTGPGRSGPEIRAALATSSPAEVNEFEKDFRQALEAAATSFDTSGVDEVIARWWRVAVARSIQLTPHERDQVSRARRGDFSGSLARAQDGTFLRVE